MNLIDGIFLGVLVLVMFLSARKGLLYVLLQYAATVCAALLSKGLSIPVSGFIYSRYIQDKVLYSLTEILPHGSAQGEIQSIADSVMGSLPDYIRDLAEQFHVMDAFHAGSADPNGQLSIAQIESDYIAPVVSKTLSVICLIVLFFILLIGLKILVYFLNKALTSKKDGVLSTANKLLGALLGAARGALVVLAAAVILSFTASFLDEGSFKDMVTNSYVCNYLSTLIL